MMFRKIRKRIGKYLLNRKLHHINRVMCSTNLKDAKSIGVVFDSKDSLSLKIVKEFQKKTISNSIKTEILGFHHKRKSEETNLSTGNSNFINSKDFNYLYQPKSQALKEFIEKEFDILIVIYPKDHLQIQTLSCLSKAKFKVGNGKLNHHSFDLSIDSDPLNVEEMFENALLYLSKITTSKV